MNLNNCSNMVLKEGLFTLSSMVVLEAITQLILKVNILLEIVSN